jgi:hypothetical protein
MVIFTKVMSTGSILNHGVSGYACTGVPGDFQEQTQGNPWRATFNDPIFSYNNAQNHTGIMMSNFNESWNAGILEDANMSAQPYRIPLVGDVDTPPPPKIADIKIVPINYPELIGQTYPQQLPSSRVHEDVMVHVPGRQNLDFEDGSYTGEHKAVAPGGNIPTHPNTQFFQGASTDTGVHPNNDTANQGTTANTTRPDMRQGQQPTQKLPNGMTINVIQPQEPPALWQLAPPPDPPVLPGEGTAPLRPTNPAWW